MSAIYDRRSFLKFAGTTAAAAVLAACAPAAPADVPADEPADEPAEPAAPEEVTLLYGIYMWEPAIVAINEMHAEYKESHPNVTVEVMSAPWGDYWPKVESMAAAGTPVNISMCEPHYFVPWQERGLLLDLAPLADTVDESIFFSNVVCSSLYNKETELVGCNSGGSIIPAWPGYGFGNVVYIDMDLVKAAGLEYPDEDWDWDDFREYMVAMTIDANGKHPGESGYDGENGEQYGSTSDFDFSRKVLKDFIWHAGGYRWKLDGEKCGMTEPEAMEAISYMYDLAVDTGVCPPPGGFEGIAQPFLTSKIGTLITGSWNVEPWIKEITDFEWDIAREPIGPGGPDSRLTHAGWGDSLCIFKDCEHLEETKDVLRFDQMTKEGTKYLGRFGIPLVRDAVDDEWMAAPDGKHLPAHREVMVTVVEEENGYNTLELASLVVGDLYDVMAPLQDEIRLDRITPDEFAQRCCEGFEKIWAEE